MLKEVKYPVKLFEMKRNIELVLAVIKEDMESKKVGNIVLVLAVIEEDVESNEEEKSM